jgi:hypothetical protein
MRDLDDSDPTFVSDLRDSQAAVWRVARWLSGRGNNVTVRPVRVRPTTADIQDYGDSGDLEIIQRLEVKQRALAFTSAADYPFSTVIVDVAHTWDRAQPKPVAYVILNNAGTVAAVVHARTFPRWRKVTKHDQAKGRDRTFYECPLSCVKFLAIT